MLTVCPGPGGDESCGRLVPKRDKRCPDCLRRAAERKRWRKSVRSTVAARSSENWQEVRRAVLGRDRGLCVLCGEPANTVHLRPDYPYTHADCTPQDCVLLCRRCHGQLDGSRAGPNPRRLSASRFGRG
jgi:5-methylcytosine-specific restriction endonuclease McrA